MDRHLKDLQDGKQRRFSISQARNSLPSLVHAAEAGRPIELTRRDKPVAVLLSIEEYRRLRPPATDLWSAIETFRRGADLDDFDIDDILAEVRDRSTGRDLDF